MGKPESKGGNGYRNIVKVETTATIRGDHVFKMTPDFLCLVFEDIPMHVLDFQP